SRGISLRPQETAVTTRNSRDPIDSETTFFQPRGGSARARSTLGELLRAIAAAMPLRAFIRSTLIWSLVVIATVVIATMKHNPLLGEPRFFRELIGLGLAIALLLAVSALPGRRND